MITFVPVGGLANRMRAIASAVTLAQAYKHPLRIVWFRDSGLNCRFDRLFCRPTEYPEVEIREAESWGDSLRYDRPRRRNLHLPRLVQQAMFSACFYEQDTAKFTTIGENSEAWCDFLDAVQNKRKLYIASYSKFYTFRNRDLENIFCPLPSIRRKAEEVTARFDKHTIGVHIRRTDHAHAIAQSPLSVFIERMEREIRREERSRFYVASDSQEVKEELRRIFGERILTHPFSADRNREEGVQDALTEMFILSATKHVIGSAQSSFPEIAAGLTRIPYIPLQKKKP